MYYTISCNNSMTFFPIISSFFRLDSGHFVCLSSDSFCFFCCISLIMGGDPSCLIFLTFLVQICPSLLFCVNIISSAEER